MTTEWYHGTNESSARDICCNGINFTKSKTELDFGPGFYLTDDLIVAQKRAKQKTKVFNRIFKTSDKPAIVKVTLDENEFEDLQIKNFESCNEEWLHFVLANRMSLKYLKAHQILEHNISCKYDIVRGSIADSKISKLANDIVNGDIPFNEISVYEILTSSGRALGNQLSIHTELGLDCIISKSYYLIERG